MSAFRLFNPNLPFCEHSFPVGGNQSFLKAKSDLSWILTRKKKKKSSYRVQSPWFPQRVLWKWCLTEKGDTCRRQGDLWEEGRVVLGQVSMEEKRSCPAEPAPHVPLGMATALAGWEKTRTWREGPTCPFHHQQASTALACFAAAASVTFEAPLSAGAKKVLNVSDIIHKCWTQVEPSRRKFSFETMQSSKLAYIPCAVIHSLLFCISVCFNEVVQCSSSKSKTYDAP